MCEVLVVDSTVSCQGGVGANPSLLLSDAIHAISHAHIHVLL